MSKTQTTIVEQWFGVARYVYNQTVEYLQQPGTKANWKAIKGEILRSLPDFCADVPYQIKSIAIKDACTAVREAKRKFAKTKKVNKVRFRSRKTSSQSCYIPKSAVKAKGVYYTILGELQYAEDLPEEFGDCRLVRHYDRYYLTVPYEEVLHVGENQARVVALDPGVRTFQTFFSESSYGHLAKDANLVIQSMCLRLDNVLSQMSKATGKRKKRLHKVSYRLRRKIKNKIDEMQHKITRFLVDNFDIILLPTFETSDMVSKDNRRIRSKTARQMLNLGHYRFKQFLKHKAFETGKIVLDVNEAYTSKTVSWTGEIINNLGGRKVVKSEKDGRTLDRDINGARGIFLRAVVDTPLLRDNLSASLLTFGNDG